MYCWYTELLLCRGCFGDGARPIPWRCVHNSDFGPRPVCAAAAAFIDSVWCTPAVNLAEASPAALARSPALRRCVELRRDALMRSRRGCGEVVRECLEGYVVEGPQGPLLLALSDIYSAVRARAARAGGVCARVLCVRAC